MTALPLYKTEHFCHPVARFLGLLPCADKLGLRVIHAALPTGAENHPDEATGLDPASRNLPPPEGIDVRPITSSTAAAPANFDGARASIPGGEEPFPLQMPP
jgi:hypothetical protein